jgi:hypothetical protein
MNDLLSTTAPELRPRFLHHYGSIFIKEVVKTALFGAGIFLVVSKVEKGCSVVTTIATSYMLVDMLFSNFVCKFAQPDEERSRTKLMSVFRRACVMAEMGDGRIEPKVKCLLHAYNVIYGLH